MLLVFVVALIVLMVCLAVRSKKEWPSTILSFVCGAAAMYAAYLIATVAQSLQ